ncbi:MAG: hypothetical protein EAZ55_08920 [Cytophagales bacterium]|nr:MAG: hypothetical protein EAZ55_08920 [Cytophagales bacterium]
MKTNRIDPHLTLLWKKEEKKLLEENNILSLWVALLTYSGGTSLGSYLMGGYEMVWKLFPAQVLLPVVIILLGWIGYKTYKSGGGILLSYAIGIGLFSSIAYSLLLVEKKSLEVLLLSNIPVIITFTLLTFWQLKHQAILMTYGFLANLLGYTFVAADAPWSYFINIWSILLPIVLGSVYFSNFRYKTFKQRFLDNQVLNQQKEAITESIQYASRIQQAVLPTLSSIKAKIPQFFLFYQPKDIVSGDFYWVEQASEKEEYWVAVGDATGHGIPGSLMAMIGINLLNQIIRENPLLLPNQVLSELDLRIRILLKQSDGDNLIQDGMDIALLKIDQENKKIHFAGANRPLFYVENNQPLIQIKADKLPIGNTIQGDKQFSLQTFEITQEEKRFYLFSDGIIDQFDAEDQKRLGSKRWRSWVEALQNTAIEDQSLMITQQYEKWKGNTPQTDDIIVVGLQI